MADAPAEPKGRSTYAYVVLAYVQPPVEVAEEIVAREDLTLVGVYEAPTHEDAAQQAAEEYPPRVGQRRTFVATLASKWREFDFGTETKIEVKGTPAQTHPQNPAMGAAVPTPHEDPGASAHPPEGQAGTEPEVAPVEVEPPAEHHFLDEDAVGLGGMDDGDPLPGEDVAA